MPARAPPAELGPPAGDAGATSLPTREIHLGAAPIALGSGHRRAGSTSDAHQRRRRHRHLDRSCAAARQLLLGSKHKGHRSGGHCADRCATRNAHASGLPRRFHHEREHRGRRARGRTLHRNPPRHRLESRSRIRRKKEPGRSVRRGSLQPRARLLLVCDLVPTHDLARGSCNDVSGPHFLPT